MQIEAFDRDINHFKIGDSVEMFWIVTKQEIDNFADLSGDLNPLHTDADYARKVGYEDRVAHGLLLGSKLSGLIGMQLPGRRCLLVDQHLSYPNPAYAGDRVQLMAIVSTMHLEMKIIELKVSITKPGTDEHKKIQVARGKMICKILS